MLAALCRTWFKRNLSRCAAHVQEAECASFGAAEVIMVVVESIEEIIDRRPAKDAFFFAGNDAHVVFAGADHKGRLSAKEVAGLLENRFLLVGGQQPHARRSQQEDGRAVSLLRWNDVHSAVKQGLEVRPYLVGRRAKGGYAGRHFELPFVACLDTWFDSGKYGEGQIVSKAEVLGESMVEP